MLLPSRVAGRTLGLRGPDLARGPEVARLCASTTYPASLRPGDCVVAVDIFYLQNIISY